MPMIAFAQKTGDLLVDVLDQRRVPVIHEQAVCIDLHEKVFPFP